MWKKPGTAVPIDASQLVIGLYIWLDLRWDEHAFLTNRLMLKTAHDIAVIQSYNTAGRLYYYPEKSTARPAPSPIPRPTCTAPCRSTMAITSRGSAPIAIRTPISGVRRLTENAITP